MDAREVATFWEANAEAWTHQVRAGHDVYRDALNTPAFLAMLPPVSGQAGLDIGCGEGANTRQLAGRGARMTGVDIAPTFIRHARDEEARASLGIDYVQADACALPFADATFDFAVAFMSMMDVGKPEQAVAEAFRVVQSGGFFQFSILHPCFVPPYRKNVHDQQGRPVAVHVARYFDGVDGEVESWYFSTAPQEQRERFGPFRIPRFHRTLSQWVAMTVAAGFAIEAMGEPMADKDLAAAIPKVADTRVAPIFLHLRLRKPACSASSSAAT